MTSVVIAEYVRSPYTLAYKGALKSVRADDLAAQTILGLIKKSGVDPKKIEDLILGCAFPEGEQGFNLARLVGLLAGLPQTMGGTTVNRFCGSSMQSIHMAAGNIMMGAGDAFICAGVESMSRVPMTGFNPMPNPELYKKNPGAYMGMGETAENLAHKYKISREQQDAFAVESQKKAAAAMKNKAFDDEIIPIKTRYGIVKEDGCPRPGTDMESLAGLKPAFDEKGSVTAGTSSPLTDGASAVLVCSAEFAKKNKLKPIAEVKSFAISGCDPKIMGIGPVDSSKKALKRAGLTMDDIGLIELNEAFASQSLAVIEELKLADMMDKINIDGGAIALGHPLGSTGARIVGKLATLMQREGVKYGLATQCIGGGQGIATVLEAL